MSDPRAEGEAFVAEFTESITEIRERGERAREVLRTATASATHPDLPVTVTVDSAGALADLQLGAGALDLDAAGLAHAVLDTSRRARRQLLRNAEGQVSDIMGPDSGSVTVLREQLASLDAIVDTHEVAPRRAARLVPDTDDFDDDDVFAGRGR